MREHHIGYLIVVSVVAREADPRTLRVGDVMTQKPLTVMTEDSVADALAQMKRIGVRRLPVVGYCVILEGVVSLDDVLTAMARDLNSAAAAIVRAVVSFLCFGTHTLRQGAA